MPISSSQLLPSGQESGVLVIHLLGRCNLHCQHCYMDSTAWRESSIPLDVVVHTLGNAERLGIRTVYLSGGEPFLYSDLPQVLAFGVGARPFYMAVCTNGTLIRRAEAERLKAANVGAQVSIDGEEAYHDSFRGSVGAFRAATRGIQELVAAGVPVTAVVTICKENRGCLPWMAEWAAGLGVECISVQSLQQVGRGAGIAHRKLSEQQVCELFMQVSDLGYAYRSRGLRFTLAYRSRNYLADHPCAAYVCTGAKCHRGVNKEIKTLIIREDGTVLPEIATLDPRFALGNVNQAPLQELVKRYFIDGYADFHSLCSAVYDDLIPTYPSPIVPWNEILSERSWTYSRDHAPGLERTLPVLQ
jgi:Fe-coproporphyrin III synthase